MDCLRFPLIPSILGNLRGKCLILNEIFIPDRDYGVKQAFVNLFFSLLVWAVRHKRLRPVAEISIPDRGYLLPISPVNSDCTLISNQITRKKFNWSSYTGLIKLCYHYSQVWLQRLSAGTETRWTIFYSSDAHSFLISSQKPPSKQFHWRVIWKTINRWNFLTCNLTPQKNPL